MELPPFKSYLLKFRHVRPVERHFSHAVFINGLLSGFLGHPLPNLSMKPTPAWIAVPFPVESGRVAYNVGEPYHLPLTFLGHDFPDMSELTESCKFTEEQAHNGSAADSGLELMEISPLPMPNLSEQIQAVAGFTRITLQFLTPLDIEQKFKDGTSRHFSDDYFDLPHFFKTLGRRMFDISKLAGPVSEKPDDAEPPPAQVESMHLFWLTIPPSNLGPHEPTYYGVVGKIILTGDFSSCAEQLVLGQYFHLGRRTNFGLGRYVIKELEHLRTACPSRAIGLIDSITDSQNLMTAWEDVKADQGCPGVDGMDLDSFERDRDQRLETLGCALKAGTYRPGPLLGIVLERPEGKMRALAIPTVTDRIAQRATAQVLQEPINQLLEECSFGYRKGRSRLDAKADLERLHKDGYRFVLRADIEDFFDEVDWELLYNKLEALFPCDLLNTLIKHWVESPVQYRDKAILRSRGLPQGAVISPLLANLFLDEFDESIQKYGFRLVRYADDFIILCKTKEQISAALEEVRAALERLHLKLNLLKTEVTSFDQGFHYLGYLFCKSLVLESHGDMPGSDNAGLEIDLAQDLPRHGWLSTLSPSDVIPFEPARGRTGNALEDLMAKSPEPEFIDEKAPLYLDSPNLRVKAKGGMLLIADECEEHDFIEIPLEKLSHIVSVGHTRLTLPVLLNAAARAVPVFLTRANGEMLAAVTPQPRDWQIWQAQAAFQKNIHACLEFSRAIVMARLHNQVVLLRNRRMEELNPAADSIQTLEQTAGRVIDMDTLHNLEGAGDAIYFGGWRKLLDPEWRFDGRVKHPSPDPVNAMLSYGYTLLHYRCSTELQTAGLNPEVGIFHQTAGRYHALAADLQEEFRHVVDALVLRLVRKREFQPMDFVYPERSRACWMTSPVRKRFIAAFEERLKDLFRLPDSEKPTCYRDLLRRQALSLKRLVLKSTTNYLPIIMR